MPVVSTAKMSAKQFLMLGEDPPGIRSNAFGALYLAYLRDPDGNKLCGLHRIPQE